MSCRWSMLVSLLLVARLAPAQGLGGVSPQRASLALEIGLRHTGQLDQTLSPLRYGGGALAVRTAFDLPHGALRYGADADFAFAMLLAKVGSGDSPSMRGITGTVHLGAARLLERSVAGFSLAPGVRLAGRAAVREHRFTRSQTYGRYDSSAADSYDEILALQPQLLSTRTLGSGSALSLALAVSAFAVSAHPYRPASLGSPTNWIASGPSGALLADGSLELVRPSARRLALGARYSVHLLRLRGASAVAEVSHQLGATVSWRRGAR